MKRVMVTGADGMTGKEVTERASTGGWDVIALAHADLDITDAGAVSNAAAMLRPGVVINCAAYTAVDRAESEQEIALAVNADGARNVARAAAMQRVPLIHVSTDYVFSGDARMPYTPDAKTGPIGAYGRTKLAGEIAVREETPRHVIVRTSWVFSHRGSNFVRTMARLATEREELRVVDDQIGRPTSSADLAAALLIVADAMLGQNELNGTYHFANAEETTWFDFARAVVESSAYKRTNGRPPRVVPIPSSEFATVARRPAYSVLDTSSFTRRFGVTPRPWREALRDTLALM